MRYVREELNEMEHQVALLQRESKDKDRQLADEREDCERVRTPSTCIFLEQKNFLSYPD